MLCQNCGKNEVNFRYTQIINGVKKEMALCDKCAKSLGLESLDFNMPINFSSFLGDFLNDAMDTQFLPSFTKTGGLQCDNCGMTYDEFVDTGKFGCSHCYDVFSNRIDPVLKRLHGETTYLGRRAKVDSQNDIKQVKTKPKEVKTEVDKLKEQLKEAIKVENYEEAARLRDEIKKHENK